MRAEARRVAARVRVVELGLSGSGLGKSLALVVLVLAPRLRPDSLKASNRTKGETMSKL